MMSLQESDSNNTTVAKPRRRSAFFERLTIAQTQEGEKGDSEEYQESLTNEIELWNEHINERRKLIADLKGAPKVFEFDPDTFDENDLPEDYKKFLDAKPDYDKFEKTVEALKKNTDDTLRAFKSLQQLEDMKLEEINKKLRKITKSIIDDTILEK